MTDRIRDLLDKAAIREAIERYCRGVDRLDDELIRGVYWDGANDDHGVFRGPADEFVTFVIPVLRERYESTMHTLGQSLIELDGDTARSETYFVAYHRGKEAGRNKLDTVGGRYVDRFERRGDEWRVIDRVCIAEWSQTDPDVGQPTYGPEHFSPARRDRSDLAYGPKMR